MYMAYMLPIVEYASNVWDGFSEKTQLYSKRFKMNQPDLSQD